MSGLGAMMAGGRGRQRQDHDFYPTPAECTRALMLAEDCAIPQTVWEPACGDGACARIVEGYGRKVIASDLIDRGYGVAGKDFTLAVNRPCDALITNPPFSLAEEFILTARRLGVGYMALLLKSTFWHAARRRDIFMHWPPARIHALSWRVDYLNLGRPTMECMWCVWDEAIGTDKKTVYDVLPRPHALTSCPLLELMK